MLIMVLIVFAANVFLAKPPIDSLLFAIALAVGLSPELLPAIVSVTRRSRASPRRSRRWPLAAFARRSARATTGWSRHLAEAVAISAGRMVKGEEVGRLRDEALWRVAAQADVFAEIDPTQKERIIPALRSCSARSPPMPTSSAPAGSSSRS